MRTRRSRGNGIIRGRRCPRIQNCPTCGRMRVHHSEGLYVCAVKPEVIEALRRFKSEHGKRWKNKLCLQWSQDRLFQQKVLVSSELALAAAFEPSYVELLRQARGLIGPRRLYNIIL